MKTIESLRETLKLQAFGLTKVPLLAFCSPRVVHIDDDTCAIKIPLSWRTKNHFRSMYFGALAAGADATAGLLTMRHAAANRSGVRLLFKDFHADFVKRADGDTIFRCEDGGAIRAAVDRAAQSGERVNFPVTVVAYVAKYGEDPVAKFRLTVSLKKG